MTDPMLNLLKPIRVYLLLCGLIVIMQPLPGRAQQNSDAAKPAAQRDGQHDFDFEIGSWNIHLKRRLHPLTGPNTWVEFDGTSVTRPVWDGRSQLEQFETDSAAAGHIEGLTLRLYNPETRQWNLWWANAKDGTMLPAQVGQFKNGVGEFYGQDTLNGKLIFIRFLWTKTNTDKPHFEQSFSDDGGKTWEVNWITDQTRVGDQSAKALAWPNSEAARATSQQASDGQHDFDPLIGSWKFHLKRLDDRLAGSTSWTEFEGTGACYKVWDGRAQLDTVELDSPTGHIEGLTVRLFNPQSHQWRLYWANSKDGVLSLPPPTGEFRNGRGEFIDQEPYKGRAILVRYSWTDVATSTPHFEQSFSDDGGKTWEVNWITDQTRVNDESDRAR